MATKEQSVFLKVKQLLDGMRAREPLWWFRTHGGGRTKKGLPDICVCFYGLSVWIELKKPGGKASKIQLQRIKEIRAAGGTAIIADNAEQVAGVLRAIRPANARQGWISPQ